jgi:Potential Monad-binding region of RPAP3
LVHQDISKHTRSRSSSDANNKHAHYIDGTVPGDYVAVDDIKLARDKQLEQQHPDIAKDTWHDAPSVHYSDGTSVGESVPIDTIKIENDKQIRQEHADVAATKWPTDTASISDQFTRIAIADDSDSDTDNTDTHHDAQQPQQHQSSHTVHFSEGNTVTEPGDIIANDDVKLIHDKQLEQQHPDIAKTSWHDVTPPTVTFADQTAPGDDVQLDEDKIEIDKQLQQQHPDIAETKWPTDTATDDTTTSRTRASSVSFADNTAPGDSVPIDTVKILNDIQLRQEHADVADTKWPERSTNDDIISSSSSSTRIAIVDDDSDVEVAETEPKSSAGLPQQQQQPIASTSSSLSNTDDAIRASLKAPKTLYEFERTWRDVRGNTTNFAAYMKLVKGSNLVKVNYTHKHTDMYSLIAILAAPVVNSYTLLSERSTTW